MLPACHGHPPHSTLVSKCTLCGNEAVMGCQYEQTEASRELTSRYKSCLSSLHALRVFALYTHFSSVSLVIYIAFLLHNTGRLQVISNILKAKKFHQDEALSNPLAPRHGNYLFRYTGNGFVRPRLRPSFTQHDSCCLFGWIQWHHNQ